MVKWKTIRNKASDLYGKGKEAYEKYDQYTDIDLNSSEVTPGLTPIGDTGWYSTPNEPADPQDCDRYPDSIFCGENPLSETPVSLEPEIIINQCDMGIRLSPTFGWIKLPPFHLVYRAEKCRNLPPAEPFRPPNKNYSSPVTIPYNRCLPDAFGTVIIVQNSEELIDENIFYWYLSTYEGNARSSYAKRVKLLAFDYPLAESRTVYRTYYGKSDYYPVIGRVKLQKIVSIVTNEFGFRQRWGQNEKFIKQGDTYTFNDSQLWEYEFTAFDMGRAETFDGTAAGVDTNFATLFLSTPNAALSLISKLRNHRSEEFSEPDANGNIGSVRISKNYDVAIKCTAPKNDDNPPPPHDRRKCCMSCCPQNSQSNNDQLLKVILQKVNKLSDIVGVNSYPGKLTKTRTNAKGETESKDVEIKTLSQFVGQIYTDVDATAKAVGIDDYPVKLPESLIKKHGEDNSTTKEVQSITQLFAWYLERFDELMGQFEIPIEIQDTDVIKDGDQPATIKLPNIAEAIAELFMLAFQAQVNTDVLINMVTRVLLEGGQDKQQNFISYHLLLSLVDWAGFKTKDVKKDMNLLFTPGKNRLDQLLDESKQKVVVQEFDEKFGLEIDLMRFRKAASILDANFFRKINPNANIKSQILKYLSNSLDVADKLNSGSSDKADKEFKEFLSDTEKGFTNTTGITDNQHPYGRDYESRPKIKDLTPKKPKKQDGGK